MILTVAMALSLVGSVSGQAMPLVTIDKTNLAPPPPNAPPGTLDTVQPEGKAFVGQVPDTWGVYVMFGTNTTANGFAAFANTTANVFPIQQPTPPMARRGSSRERLRRVRTGLPRTIVVLS